MIIFLKLKIDIMLLSDWSAKAHKTCGCSYRPMDRYSELSSKHSDGRNDSSQILRHYSHTHTHTRTHARTHAHTYTHTHTHTHTHIGNVIIKNIHVTWSNIPESPLGAPSRVTLDVFSFLVMRRPPFPNWHSTYSRIYWAILKMKRPYPSGSQKQEKEEKRKHDSGKLSFGDNIDLMIII